MSDSKTVKTALEADLGRMFRSMRDAEALAAPACPIPADQAVATARFSPPRKLAGGLAIALVAAVLLPRSPAAPEMLYLDIMSANTLVTEDLLLASPTLLPEMSSDAALYPLPAVVESPQWN